MKALLTLSIILLIPIVVFGQKIELDSTNNELVGHYQYCATFNSDWMMIADDDSTTTNNFLLGTCAYLTISKITKKEHQYLEKDYPAYLSEANVYRGLSIFIGCKGHTRFMNSTDASTLELGNHIDVEEVQFKNDYQYYLGHFIYIGCVINDELFWYKYIKV